jgi:Holliday junction resolvase
MTDIYERELKGILGGETKFVERAGTWDAAYTSLRKHPFLVVKAGGSFGIDMLAVRDSIVLPIEVKASASPVFRFSKSRVLVHQAMSMTEACTRAGLVPIYAYRLKRQESDPWRLFRISGGNSFTSSVPMVEKNGAGNMIMRWGNGLPLGKFIGSMRR